MNKKVCVYWCDITNLTFTDNDFEICSRITGLENPNYMRNVDLVRHVTGLLLAEWGENQFKSAPHSCPVKELKRIYYEVNHKPYFVDSKSIMFNISHSGDIVMCALSDCEVGVDIERVTNPISEIMERICSKQEIDWINKKESVESQYCLWTYKESFLKCIGVGIKGIRNTISMVENGELLERYDSYQFSRLFFREGYEAAICTSQPVDAYYVEEVGNSCLYQIIKMGIGCS